MLKRILVPLDGSALSSAILPSVYPIARSAGAGVVLLRVVPEIGMRIGAPTPWVDEQTSERPGGALGIEDYESIARRYLNQVASELTRRDIAARVRVVTGPITESILEVASDERADLIAMSTHGRGGLGRFLLGSIASQVVHYAKTPVMLQRATSDAHPPAERRYQKILVPLDGSDFSRTVLPYVAELAGRVGAQVVLLQVVPELEPEISEVHWMFTFGGPASIGEVPGRASTQTGTDPSLQQQWIEAVRAEVVRRTEYEMEAAQSNLNAAAADLKLAHVPIETMVQVGRPTSSWMWQRPTG